MLLAIVPPVDNNRTLGNSELSSIKFSFFTVISADDIFSILSIFSNSIPILYPLLSFRTICESSLVSYLGIRIPVYANSALILIESPISISFRFKNSNDLPL